MIKRSLVSLQFRDEYSPGEGRRTLSWHGLSADHVSIAGARELEFRWSGSNHYVALHDLRLDDGETVLQDTAPFRLLDLRDRLTFVPPGCEISGWSRLSPRTNSFTALYFDPEVIANETKGYAPALVEKPMLYFTDRALQSTLNKIQGLLQDPSPVDAIYSETLGLLAAIELERAQRHLPNWRTTETGKLSAKQERVVRDYVDSHLHMNISLSDLAALVGLSRFHFARAFKKATGLPPHRYVLRQRVDRAKVLLAGSAPIAELARSVGFSTPEQFASTFRKMTGMTPLQFRRLDR